MGSRQDARARAERSPSVKRVREGDGEGEWREAGTRRKNKPQPKVVTGTADLSDLGDLAGPAQFWIGNTQPSTKIKAINRY